MSNGIKLLTIYDTDFCNFNCSYCLAQRWNRKGKNLKPHITASHILDYIDEYFPSGWDTERTGGGEPAMHNERDKISAEISKRGIRQAFRTNGSIPIKRVDGMKIVSTWHKGNYIPIESDLILILKNPADDWKAKQRYCEEKGIPYELKVLKSYHKPRQYEQDDSSDVSVGKIMQWQVILPNGCLVSCNKSPVIAGHKIQNMSKPNHKPPCAFCQPCCNYEKIMY
jgi:organic radical activating enzyme